MCLDPDNGQEVKRIKVGRQFLRGLYPEPGGRLLVGMQNRLVLLSREAAGIRAELQISSNPNECVYDAKPLPDEFDSLPGSLRS